MDEQYILVIKGKPEGPFTIGELKELNIQPGDFVKTPSMTDYKEAHEVAELRTLLGFKFEPVAPQYFGAFDQRVLAAIIDWLMVTGILVLIAYVPVLLIGDKMVKALVTASLLVLIPLTYLIYHVVMEGSSRQATYGKKLLKIKVCGMDGAAVNYSKATARNIAKICSLATLCIGYLMCFFNKKQQCLHDVIAGTLVTRDRLV